MSLGTNKTLQNMQIGDKFFVKWQTSRVDYFVLRCIEPNGDKEFEFECWNIQNINEDFTHNHGGTASLNKASEYLEIFCKFLKEMSIEECIREAKEIKAELFI